MSTNSKIEWTEMTWNPVTGCSKVSQGCKHCYAERLATRLRAMGMDRYRNGFNVTLHWDLVDLPLQWKSPRLVFVNSMSDLFHHRVPLDFIRSIFSVMARCPHHTFQILTKRSQRLSEIAPRLEWPPNVWMGVSVENQAAAFRIRNLRTVPARIRFLSVEPLLGPIDALPLDDIDWVIVGGESGPKARSMEKEWVESIFNQCRASNVPFFFKQWGGVRKKQTGRSLNGRIYDEMPRSTDRRESTALSLRESLSVRDLPTVMAS
ncbi:MAG TPA: phage Gp37/Gp68 family protein [Terriglobia bacterium]|nr:phage Gp37/Gp68 family protein [Terriglobia bacterium]